MVRMSTPVGKRALVALTTPVVGLPRRALPLIAVFTQSIAAVAPSGAAAVIPMLVLSTTGGAGAVAAFAAAAVVVVLVSACLRPMAQRMAAVGGLYTYTARGLGAGVALPTGWSALIGYGAVSMAGLVAVGTYLSNIVVAVGLIPDSPTAMIVGLAVVAGAIATIVMLRGIRVSALITLLVECVSLTLLGLLLTILWLGVPHDASSVSAVMTWHASPRTMAIGIVVAISAYVGFESSTTLSGEARQPFQSVPRTLRWTPILAAGAYLIAVPVQALALADAPAAVRDSSTPLVALLAAQDSQGLAAMLDFCIAASFFACTLASANALVRVLFSMGREGVVPSLLGRTHPRFKTPAPAITAAMLVVTTVPVGALLLGLSPDEGLRAFLTLSACGYLGTYLAGCIATPALLRRIGELTPGILILSAFTTCLLVALTGAAFFVAIRERAPVLITYLGLIGIAVAYTLLLKRFAPQRLESVGVYDETQRADLLSAVPFR